MKELLELDQWDDDGVLRYTYSSTDMEYLEDKADRIYKVIRALNKVEKRYDVRIEYSAEDDSPEVNLHIQIETNEQYKCKKNKDRKEGDI
jgi:asparagine synthetase A